jgi:hypothetical protein
MVANPWIEELVLEALLYACTLRRKKPNIASFPPATRIAWRFTARRA